MHDFPGSFASVHDARAFCEGFFAEYNHVHRLSGIGWHTPASVHFGTAPAVDQAVKSPSTWPTQRSAPGTVRPPTNQQH